jgi:hypothetical protein
MDINFLAVLFAGLSIFLTGGIYYHPKVMGTAWMKASYLSVDDLNKGGMTKLFISCFLLSLLIGLILNPIVIHQFGPLGMIGGPQFIESAKPSYAAFMQDYGDAYRTFKHGALHGFMTALFLVFPILGINALLERKSWKYIGIHSGYWLIALTIAGGIIGGWQ